MKHKPITLEDYKKLANAVLKDALTRIEKNPGAAKPELEWLFSSDIGPLSFLIITKVLEMRPELIRYNVRRCIHPRTNTLDMELNSSAEEFDIESSPRATASNPNRQSDLRRRLR